MTRSSRSTWELKAEGSIQGHPRPLGNLEASLDYMKPCLQKGFGSQGGGEMAPDWLRVIAVFQRTRDWFSAPTSNGSQPPVIPAPGDPTLSSGFC